MPPKCKICGKHYWTDHPCDCKPAKVAEQPCAGINKAALDQAGAARKRYRADTPVSLYSIEGEDAVFIAAYLEAVSADQPVELPERDKTKPAEEQGIFRKFDVRRTDGSDQPGGKHYGCEYFVLDIDHDPHAKPALAAYAESCGETHPELSKDMIYRYELNTPEREIVDDVQLWKQHLSDYDTRISHFQFREILKSAGVSCKSDEIEGGKS